MGEVGGWKEVKRKAPVQRVWFWKLVVAAVESWERCIVGGRRIGTSGNVDKVFLGERGKGRAESRLRGPSIIYLRNREK